jgi:glutamyl-tRNA reductase
VRERVTFTPEEAQRAAEELRTGGVLSETLVLSTCNRSEVYGVSAEPGEISAVAMELFLATFHKIEPSVLGSSLYRRHDREAVRHLFRVSAGLDSMLLGEAEILGQVRDAYKIALDHGATGPVLNRMFQNALEVGKRVRTETEIGARPMSVAFAGVKLAERIFGSLKGHSALILGAGATGEQVVNHLRDRGIGKLRVSNRSTERAAELAGRVGAEVVPWSELQNSLEWPDLVVCSVMSPEPILTREMVTRAMKARSDRSLLLIDLGMPRNVDQNKKARQAEVPRVELIVEEQIERFESWQAGVEAGVVVKELRTRMAGEREAFLRERAGGMAHLSAEDRARVAGMMEELLDRVLLEPAEKLKGVKDLRRKLQNLEALRDLFKLDRDDS